MKKLILVILIAVMTATPCFAQEVETNQISSLEGTYWEAKWIVTIPPLPYPIPIEYLNFGFEGGEVYLPFPVGAFYEGPRPHYIDMPVASMFLFIHVPPAGLFGLEVAVGTFQPALGIGFMTWFAWWHYPTITMVLLTKTDDNWTSLPEEILSISPNQGEQGTILTGVTIMTQDTTFEDYGVSAIQFHPKDGLTVSNINVISNTEIEFDLEIAIDAPVGTKGISVVFDDGIDDGIDYLYNSEVVFEVLEKTN